MKRVYGLTVRGKAKEWHFTIEADRRHVEDWRADGLECDEIVNTIPAWAVDMGLTRIWCFAQDVFYMRWLRRRDG